MSAPLLLQVDEAWIPPLTSAPKILAFDTETRGQMYNRDFQVLCVSWAFSADVGYMAPIDQVPPVVWEWLVQPNVLKVGHNIKYDAQATTLHWRGINHTSSPWYLWPFHDTRHIWGLIDESAIDQDRADGKDYLTIFPSLKVLARRAGLPRWTSPEELFLNTHGVSTKTKDHEKFMKVWDQLPEELLYSYSAMDAVASWVLHDQLWAELLPAEQQHLKFKMLVERSFIDMELNGIETDVEHLDRELRLNEREAGEISAELMESSGITTLSGSSPQLGSYLYDTLGCPSVADATDSGRQPCDKKTLARLADDDRTPAEAKEFLERLAIVRGHEAIIKQARIYLNAVRDDGRIHASFNLSGTRTGRTSSAVNVQNPARTGPVRSCFVSRFDGR